MIRKICLASAFAVLASVAVAEEQCPAPAAPPVPKGETATPDEMVAAQTAVQAFADDASVYQQCMWNALEASRAAALAKKQPPNPKTDEMVLGKIDRIEAERQRVVAEFNAEAEVFKARIKAANEAAAQSQGEQPQPQE